VGYAAATSRGPGAAFFVAQADQRIYRQELAGGTARPITPAFGAASTPVVSPDGRWVAYVHTYEDVDCIAIVDSEGKHLPHRLAEGRDFYMQPAWHPAGDRLAWVEWDHPRMPWDGTELKLARLAFPEDGLPVVSAAEVVAGGPETSIFQGSFAPDGRSIVYVSDESGWGHLCRRDLPTGVVTQVTSGELEHGRPPGRRACARSPSPLGPHRRRPPRAASTMIAIAPTAGDKIAACTGLHCLLRSRGARTTTRWPDRQRWEAAATSCGL